MTVIQLQLNLWQQLQQAQTQPQATNWRQLCLAFDEAIALTPVHRQLATAADAIEQMAEVLAARAEAWAKDWYRKPGDGPVLDGDLLTELVRQSFLLDLSSLVDEPDLYQRSVPEKSHDGGESVIEEVTKEQALRLAGADEEEPLPVEGFEHDEDVEAWADAIQLWMESGRMESVSIGEVIDATSLSTGKVWIAGLLSDLELHQTKDFYSFDGLHLGIRIVAQGEVAW